MKFRRSEMKRARKMKAAGRVLRRQHPAAIMRYTTKNFWLLLIPAVRALISYKFDVFRWVSGMYIDIIAIAAIFIFAWFRWFLIVFEFRPEGLWYRNGFFVRMTSEIPYDRISAVSSQQRIWQRTLRCAYVYIDTDSASVEFSKKAPDIKLMMRTADVSRLFKRLNSRTPDPQPYRTSISKPQLAAFSLLFSSALSGTAFIATLLMNGGNIVGGTLEELFFGAVNTAAETVSEKMSFIVKNISPATMAVVIIIAIGWFISFIMTLLRHINFVFEKSGSNIRIWDGFFSKRKYHINIGHINFADLRQNLLMKLFGVMSVNVNCSGYGKAKNEIPVLIPISSGKRVRDILRRIMPELDGEHIINPINYRYIMRYLGMPFFLIIGIIIGGGVLCCLFPRWYNVIFFTASMLELPAAWLLIVKAAAFVGSGIAFEGNILSIKYCRLFDFHTILVPADRIAKMVISRNIFQRMNGSCDIIVYTNAEYRKSHRVRGILYSDALEMAESYRKAD